MKEGYRMRSEKIVQSKTMEIVSRLMLSHATAARSSMDKALKLPAEE
jgi:hypothetical protein